MNDDWVELTGGDIPYHLRSNVAPLAMCERCRRQSWSADSIGTLDRMTQPDGLSCGGTFRHVVVHHRSEAVEPCGGPGFCRLCDYQTSTVVSDSSPLCW